VRDRPAEFAAWSRPGAGARPPPGSSEAPQSVPVLAVKGHRARPRPPDASTDPRSKAPGTRRPAPRSGEPVRSRHPPGACRCRASPRRRSDARPRWPPCGELQAGLGVHGRIRSRATTSPIASPAGSERRRSARPVRSRKTSLLRPEPPLVSSHHRPALRWRRERPHAIAVRLDNGTQLGGRGDGLHHAAFDEMASRSTSATHGAASRQPRRPRSR